MINYDKKSDTLYKVIFPNGVILGDIYQEIDGFFVFWPEDGIGRNGFWEAWVLRDIADKLDEMNGPWKKEIDKYFGNSLNFKKSP